MIVLSTRSGRAVDHVSSRALRLADPALVPVLAWPAVPASPRPPLPTRERLVRAATEILGEEPAAALTTTAVARRAGIVQSGFYAHFENMDACLAEVVERLGGRLVERIEAWMYQLRLVEHARLAASGDVDLEPTVRHCERVLRLLMHDEAFTRLLLRYRFDPSRLGSGVRAVLTRVHADVAEHLLELGRPFGVDERHRDRLELHARFTVGTILDAAALALEGDPSLAVLADHLARRIHAPILEFYLIVQSGGRVGSLGELVRVDRRD